MAKETTLKRLRLEAGMSQAKLARKADIDRGTVASAEKAGGNPSELTLNRLATALTALLGRDLTVEDLK